MPIGSQGASTTWRSDPFEWNGITYQCPPGEHWRVSLEGLERLAAMKRLIATEDGKQRWKRYENEVLGRRIHNLWSHQQSPNDIHCVVEPAESTVQRCILMTTDPGELVLDPTCGSGTTALVAERWGRRRITIDTSAIPITLCRQRLLSVVHSWYLTMGSGGPTVRIGAFRQRIGAVWSIRLDSSCWIRVSARAGRFRRKTRLRSSDGGGAAVQQSGEEAGIPSNQLAFHS